VEGLWSRSRVRQLKKRTQKQTPMRARYFSADRRGVFLSQAGPRFDLDLVQAEHHLSLTVANRLRNDEGDPFGSPSAGWIYG